MGLFSSLAQLWGPVAQTPERVWAGASDDGTSIATFRVYSTDGGFTMTMGIGSRKAEPYSFQNRTVFSSIDEAYDAAMAFFMKLVGLVWEAKISAIEKNSSPEIMNPRIVHIVEIMPGKKGFPLGQVWIDDLDLVLAQHAEPNTRKRVVPPKCTTLATARRDSCNTATTPQQKDTSSERKSPSNNPSNYFDEPFDANAFVTQYFNHPQEYVRYLMMCKQSAVASQDGSSIATLTKKDDHLEYAITHSDGTYISEHVKLFRPNEDNIRLFNIGCIECSKLLSLYLRTRDPSRLPQIKPFGKLTWSEHDKNDIDDEVKEAPSPHGKYFPEVRDARIVKKVDANTHTLVLLTDLDVAGNIKYHHLLTVIEKDTNAIRLVVSAEVGISASPLESICYLGAFTGDQHLNYGVSNDCIELAHFEKRAYEIVKTQLGLSLG